MAYFTGQREQVVMNLITIPPAVRLTPDPYNSHHVSNTLMWEPQEA